MRKITVLGLLPLAFGVTACISAQPDGSPKIQTSSDANQANVESAVSAPLRDFNVVRTKIPDVLLQAVADPYARPPRMPRAGRAAQCAQLASLLKPLDDALGADLDQPSHDEDDLLDKGRNTALGMVAGAASGAIPFRGWVRKLTGAERHDHLVQAAITGGAVRRAYLKGLGEARGCDPPATPSHLLTGSPVPTQERKLNLKPRYPIR
jgi:hypothetical protein